MDQTPHNPAIGRMPPQYDTKPPAPSPYEALGRRLALLEDRVTELEARLAEYDDAAKPAAKTTRTRRASS